MKTFKQYIKESKEVWIDAMNEVVYAYGGRTTDTLTRAEFKEIKDLNSGTVTRKDGKVFYPPFRKLINNGDKKYIGYKIVGWDGKQAFSLYNKHILISLIKGDVITDPKGVFLGTTKNFCIDYYSGMTDNQDLLLTYEYMAKDLLRGDPEHPNGEIVVKEAKLLDIEKVENGEIIKL
jgi:hypothetical protein